MANGLAGSNSTHHSLKMNTNVVISPMDKGDERSGFKMTQAGAVLTRFRIS